MFDDHVRIVCGVVVKETRYEEIFARFPIFQLQVANLTDGSNIFASDVTMMSRLS